MPFLSHAGVSLSYQRTGQGPALLLIHGWMCNRTFWERQVSALREHRQVITVDLRGHGDSSKPRASYAISTMVDDLAHLLRALGVGKVAVAGWSLGGHLAQQLALQLGDRAQALVLVGTTARLLATRGYSAGVDAARAVELRARLDADYKAFQREFAGLLFREPGSPLVAWAAQQVAKTPPYVARGAIEGFFSADLRPALPRLRIPTLVVHGRHDRLIPFAAAEYLAGHIRGAELVPFEESGHAPFIEEAEKFNQALGEFLARAAGAP